MESMTNHRNFYYEFMPFDLVNNIFSDQIRHNLDFYIDNMVVKVSNEGKHDDDLRETL